MKHVHFSFIFDLLPLDFFVADLGVLLVSPDLVVGAGEAAGVIAGVAGSVAGVVAGVDVGEAGSGVEEDGVVEVVEDGVPVGAAEDVVVPSAGGVVRGPGFLKGSSQVCRT